MYVLYDNLINCSSNSGKNFNNLKSIASWAISLEPYHMCVCMCIQNLRI